MKNLLLLIAGLIFGCAVHSQGCVANYTDPSFELRTTDPGCVANSGRIEAHNLQGGLAPFTYTLSGLGISNSTGLFSNLSAGTYTIELRDACGTVRSRQVTLVPYQFNFTFTVSKINGSCNQGEVSFVVQPNNGVYEYGVQVDGQDTVWSAANPLVIGLGKKLTVMVKDACGNLISKTWSAPPGFLPYIAEIQHNLQCDKWDLFPVYYGFTNPTVCLYKDDGTLVECKTATGNYTGGALTNFFNIPWGNYYIIVEDACFRDSLFKPSGESFGGSQIDPYDWDCNFFKMHVDGPAPPASWYAANPNVPGSPDSICLFNATTNQLVGCKPADDHLNWINPRTGQPWLSGAVWDSLPYGSYYAYIYDPCMDSTFRIDSTVSYPFGIHMANVGSCSLTESQVAVNFDPATKKPYNIRVYWPDGTLVKNISSNVPNNYVGFPYYVNGGNVTVIGTDGCGNADTAVLGQQRIELSKNVSVYNKCPGLTGGSGSGDLTIVATTFSHVTPIPVIIRKDGQSVQISPNYAARDSFYFANLETGTYIVRYDFSYCGQIELYDTVVVSPYIYPYQDNLQILQCGPNPVSFTVPTVGGLSPYTYQIIGSTPAFPSLVSNTQSNANFTVGTGSAYQSVKVRTIDRCGNSAIGDVLVAPLQDCDVVLGVDAWNNTQQTKNRFAIVFPNPSKKYFIISISQRKKTDYLIEIINGSGVKLYDKKLAQIDKMNYTFSENLKPGLYFIRLTDLQSKKQNIFKQVVN